MIDEVVEMLIDGGVTKPSEFLGCTESEIEALERHFNVRLPAVYRSFLRSMGHGCHRYIPGMSAYLPGLYENREMFEFLLQRETIPFTLKPTHFVMTELQGYAFDFFDTADDPDDPPVYAYGEGEGWTLVRPTLSEYFRGYAEGAVASKARWG